MLDGGRYSLFIAAIALAVVLGAGFLYGAVAGLAGGVVEEAMMRLLDGLFALPRLPVGIVILVFVGLHGNALTLAFSIAAVSWLTTARLVRGQVVALRAAEFIRAAEALGARRRAIALRHVLPNVAPVLVLAGVLELPALLLAESLFSVLGLGIDAPQATWGTIAYDAERWGQFWAILLPSLAIATFAVLATLVADGIAEGLDPRAPTRRRLGLLATARRAIRG
jgi:oligopeptide transport system permease protein